MNARTIDLIRECYIATHSNVRSLCMENIFSYAFSGFYVAIFPSLRCSYENVGVDFALHYFL